MWPYALVLGGICGLGAFLVIREALPVTPSLRAAVDRLTGSDVTPIVESDDEGPSTIQRAGAWTSRRLPTHLLALAGPARQDLDLIGRSPTVHYGEKALSALIALLAIPLLSLATVLLGFAFPLAIPVGVWLVCGLLAWFAPDLSAKSKAAKARMSFRRAVSTYVELLAIERASGAGVNQAAFAAAAIAQSWPFRRIAQSLELGRWEGSPPWGSLRHLATETGVSELADVADILEQAGKEGSAIYDQLRSRAAAMRDAQLDVEQQIAHDATVRMSIPGTLTILVYFAALMIPAMIAMLAT